MTKYLLKNNILMLIVKVVIMFFILNIIFIQNLGWISHKYSIDSLVKSLDNDRIEYQLIPLLDFDYEAISYQNVDEIYQNLKTHSDIRVDYRYFNGEYLLLDKDYYISAYDPSFTYIQYPCVLVYKDRLNQQSTYLDLPVCGSNELIKENEAKFPGYNQINNNVILFQNIFPEDYHCMMFQSGNQINVSLDIAQELNASTIMTTITEQLKNDFERIGYSINFLVSRLDNPVVNSSYNDALYAAENKMQNISFVLILVSALLLIVDFFVVQNKDMIAISLLQGKNKHWIVWKLTESLIIADCFNIILLFCSLSILCTDDKFINVTQIAFITGAILFVLDYILAFITVFTTDTKKILIHLRNKENNQ